MKHCSLVIIHYSHIDDFGEQSAGKNPPKRTDLLKNLIRSIEQFTDYPTEIIVMDNGGNPDDTDYLVQKVRDGTINQLVRYKDNMHFGYAFNQGFKLTSGDYVGMICNDIEMAEGWLSTCVKLLEKYPDRKLIATPFITYDKKRKTTYLDGNRLNPRAGSNCMIMKRETWLELGEFEHHRVAGTIWFDHLHRSGYWTIAPPEDLAADQGWRKGTNFTHPIVVQKTLLGGEIVDFTSKRKQ